MIYSDNEIQKAIRDARLYVDPRPNVSQYDSSSLNLRVGDDFRSWKDVLGTEHSEHALDLDNVKIEDLLDLTDPLVPTHDGFVVIKPKAFVLVRPLEYVHLPLKTKLAARVEGRSKMARLGLTAHITAPTIHAGFGGRIALEIVNHGPFHIRVRPNQSMLAQLIVEEVRGVPRQRQRASTFTDQETPPGACARDLSMSASTALSATFTGTFQSRGVRKGSRHRVIETGSLGSWPLAEAALGATLPAAL